MKGRRRTRRRADEDDGKRGVGEGGLDGREDIKDEGSSRPLDRIGRLARVTSQALVSNGHDCLTANSPPFSMFESNGRSRLKIVYNKSSQCDATASSRGPSYDRPGPHLKPKPASQTRLHARPRGCHRGQRRGGHEALGLRGGHWEGVHNFWCFVGENDGGGKSISMDHIGP